MGKAGEKKQEQHVNEPGRNLDEIKSTGNMKLVHSQHQAGNGLGSLAGEDNAAHSSQPSLYVATRRVSPVFPMDDDVNSLTTTTSDVNSEDDAASIVSRLSQIVVEEEGKLTGTGSEQERTTRRLPSGSSDGAKASSTLRAPTGPAAGLRGAKKASTHGQRVQRKPSAEGDKFDGISEPRMGRLPEIHVFEDEMSPGGREGGIRSRTKSVADSPRTLAARCLAQTASQGHLELRRNESCSFLPERGNLRQLESREALQRKPSVAASKVAHKAEPTGTPLRSAAGGSLDKLTLSSGLLHSPMLNITRSTWTLSEFDQTFNKSAAVGSAKPNETPAGDGQVISKLGADENLLARASKNVAQISGGQERKGSLANGSLAALQQQQGGRNDSRRRSYEPDLLSVSGAQSITSLASSLDSDRLRILIPGLRPKGAKRSQARNNKDDALGRTSGDEAPNEPSSPSQSCVKSCFGSPKLIQHLPIIQWLPAYSLGCLWGDLMAGLAVAVLNISTSMSAAVVARTDFGVAFRASIVNTFVYSILCSSRHTSFGSWSIMSQMLLVSVRRALSDELILARLNMDPSATWEPEEYERWHLNVIIMYTFLIGLIQLTCGLLNLGNIVASFIPEALCSSLITATAFTMAVGQLANMCGTSNRNLLSIEKNTTELMSDLKNPPLDITDIFADLFRWLQQIALLIKYSEQINPICVIISLGSVILLLLNQYLLQTNLERLFKRKIFVPSEMILLVVMIIISKTLALSENFGVATCGPINIDFVMPNLPNLKLIRELWFESVATALISYTMVYVMAKTYSNKLNYEVDCNQELIACGAGNLVGGLFDALPATASFSRTAGQVEAGGQTQMVSIINCIVLVILAQLFGHHVAELPVCVMAATLFYGFAKMMTRFSEVFMYWRVCKVDFAIWIVTFVAVLTLDIVNGFVYGFIFSILTMLYRAQKSYLLTIFHRSKKTSNFFGSSSRRCYLLGTIGSSVDVYVPLVKYPLAEEIGGIKIFQFCGPIHYVCADLFERLLRHKTRVNVKKIVHHIAEQRLAKFNPCDLNLPTHIILDFSMISYIDSAGIHTIRKIIEDYQRINITVLLASLASHVATVVKRDPALWKIYKNRFYVTLADAVHCAKGVRHRQLTDFSVKVLGQC